MDQDEPVPIFVVGKLRKEMAALDLVEDLVTWHRRESLLDKSEDSHTDIPKGVPRSREEGSLRVIDPDPAILYTVSSPGITPLKSRVFVFMHGVHGGRGK